MQVDKKIITKNIGSFIAVLLLFGTGWLYLDKQRADSFKLKEEAIKLKAEVEAKDNYLKRIDSDQKRMTDELHSKEKKLAIVEANLAEKEKQSGHDAELTQLMLKFIDEVSPAKLSEECGDDEKHNGYVRKAEALLRAIDAKAKQYNRPDVQQLFVQKYRQGIFMWKSNCKS